MRDSPLAADILQRIVGLLQASRRGAGRAVGPSDDVLSSNIEELHKQACLSGLDASEVELAFQLALGGGMCASRRERSSLGVAAEPVLTSRCPSSSRCR